MIWLRRLSGFARRPERVLESVDTQSNPAALEAPLSRPATRVGRWLLFEGGHSVRLPRWQHLLFALGLKTSYPTPNERRLV